MLNPNIKISDLQFLLSKRYGKEWLGWEVETVMSDLGFPDLLILEKLYVLKALNAGINKAISIPEFLIWTTSICNNEYAEFEMIDIPNCLELAWAVKEVKRVGVLLGESWEPSEELKDITGYLLRQEGFSSPLAPFEFVPGAALVQGQTPGDTELKAKAIQAYLAFMDKIPAFTEAST